MKGDYFCDLKEYMNLEWLIHKHPIFFMPEVMNSNWFMQEVLICR